MITGILINPKLSLTDYATFTKMHSKLPDLVYDPLKDALSTPKIVDPHDLKDAIQLFIENHQNYEIMSLNAIQFAKKRPQFEEYCTFLSKNLEKYFTN